MIIMMMMMTIMMMMMMQTTHRQGVISVRHVRAITVVLIQDVFYPVNVSILLKHVGGDQSLEEFRAEIKRALLKFQATNKRITRSGERPSIRPSNELINVWQGSGKDNELVIRRS